MRLAAVVMLAVAAGAGAVLSGWGDAAPRPRTALVLASGYAPDPLRACKPVTWRFRVANRTARGALLRFRSGQRGEVVLRRPDGSQAYRWSDTRGFTLALWNRTLPPHATWSFELLDRLRVPAGRYLMVARIAGASSVPARLVARRWVTVQGATSCAPAGDSTRPPSATAITERGELELATGSYCWTSRSVGLCADVGFLPDTLTRQPQLHVRPGSLVAFRLAVDPTEVALGYGPPGGAPVALASLDAVREPTWRVPTELSTPPEGYLVWLFVRGSAGAASRGDVSYLATLHAAS